MPAGDISAIASPTTITAVARAVPPRVAPARADERWREIGVRPPSAVAIAFVAASLILHAALLTTALLGSRAEAAVAPQEIPIEVVQEVPRAEVPKPAPPRQAAKPPSADAPEPPAREARQPSAPVDAKPPPPSPPPPSPPPATADAQRADLERQLDDLKTERRALEGETAGGGPLRDSIRAVALPSEGDGGDGEVVGYQALVFSQLAKAKDGAHEAAKPATVGVRFSVDEAGGLVAVSVAVSSGVADLDAESLAIVRRAAPFPRPPAGAERTFSANFAYAGAGR